MSDIEDPNLANDLLRNPPKTKNNLVQEIKNNAKLIIDLLITLFLIF